MSVRSGESLRRALGGDVMAERSTLLLPPYSLTGVEPTASPGWFAGSVPVDGDGEAVARELVRSLLRFLPGVHVSSGRTPQYYASSLASPAGTWAVFFGGRGDAAGTVLLQVRQAAFESVADGTGLALLAWCCANARASRLDAALDDWAGLVSPRELYNGYLGAVSRTHRLQWELHERHDGNSRLTLGSRQSDRYERVYLKSRGGRPSVRHEVELKGAAARAAADRFVGGQSLMDLWLAESQRVARWPLLEGYCALTAPPAGTDGRTGNRLRSGRPAGAAVAAVHSI